MREIKYRAWHKLAKRMVFVDMLDFVLDAYRAHAGTSSGSGHLCDIELMQYTGLNDHSGKEIYEGDIVNCTVGLGWIVWDQSKGAWRVQSFTWWMGLDQNRLEVIGNRYDNHDLLEPGDKPTNKCSGLISATVQFDTIVGYSCDTCGASCGPDEEFVHDEVRHD